MNQKTINQAITHLNKDLKLKKIIDKHNKPIFKKNNDYYNSLSKSIIYQQLSGRVANITIKIKLINYDYYSHYKILNKKLI
jgi:3-methyladenine DNA glycosylase/8-oxoguanine DNA glycosylase